MSGKRLSPVMYYTALLLLLLNCGGFFYLNKVYQLSIFHIVLFISLQIMLIILNSVFLIKGRALFASEMELIKLCSLEEALEFSDISASDLIKERIISYKKKISDFDASDKLCRQLDSRIKDELTDLQNIINSRKHSASELKTLNSQVSELTESVKKLEGHFRDYDSSISGIAQNQTESAENLNSIINSLIESIDREALIASRAEDISARMTETVKSGGDDISKTIALISAVEQLSGQITEIIAVIDNITELTNLLAMNAAIEAAHAGDAGKGFAVVAGEIQKLSSETSKSSGKISELVRNVSDTIKDMTSNAENASDGLKAIMESVNRTGDIVKDITGAIMQQSEEGNKVLTASNSIIESTDQIKHGMDRTKEVNDIFPSIIKIIEDCSGNIEQEADSIISNLEDSENRIKNLISILD